MVYLIGQMEEYIKESGRMAWSMELVNLECPKVSLRKEFGSLAKENHGYLPAKTNAIAY